MKKTKKLLSFFLAIVMVIATIPAFSITASAATTDATKSNNENSVTNRILIDNAIYTYASESAYYNYGTTISTTDSWSTKIYFRNGASSTNLKSITCLDDGSKLSVVNNILQGSFTDNKFKVSGATDVTATLLFTFNDGTKEYHRVAVKSYPVENHIACDAVKVPWRGDRTESGYTMFMRGSTGSGGAEGVWKFQKSYATSGTATHAIDDANGANGIITSDKKAYAHGYSEGGDAVPNVITKATYYIDKSCHGTSWEGLGNSELWNGTNYVVPIEVIRTKFFHNNGKYWNFDLNNMPVQNKLVRTTNSSTTNVNANGTTYGLSFTHNASVDETNRYASGTDTTCNIRIAVRTTDAGWALLKTNLIVKLFDKSTARSKYDELITKNLVESNYTASSFATYQNALMAMEAYLSNYEDTSEASTSSKVYTDLVNAYNGLAPRATESDYQTMVTAYTNYKAVAPNKDNYTTSSYNTFINDGIFDGDLVTAENGALSIKNQVEADSSAMRDLAKSTCTTYTNKFNEYLNKLVQRADFREYDAAISNITNTYLPEFTTADLDVLPRYSDLSLYNNVKVYTSDEKADTPITSQSTVTSNKDALETANTALNDYDAFIKQEALTSFITEFANFDTDVYTESVVNAKVAEATGLYKSITFNGTQYFGLDVANQADLDNKLASYLNAINDSINTYNVTVPSSVTATASYAATPTDNGDNTKTYAYPLGTDVTFTNGNADTAWYMAVQSNNTTRGQQYQTYGKSFTTKVVGDLTITAESAVAATPYYVAIIREYDKAGTGKAIDRVNYVANNSVYTLPTPTKVANYNFAGYVVNGETKAAGDVITITANTEIAAKYEYFGSELTVTVNGTEKKCVYNESVTVSAAGAYAWVEKTGADTWRPFYIGSTVTFRATESTVLKSVATVAEMQQLCGTKEAYAPNLRLNGVLVDADNRAVFHAQRIDYLPAGAEVVEFGILMNTAYYKKGTPVYDFDLGNDKADGEKNQYTVRMKSTQSLDKVQFNIFAKNAGDKPFTYRSYMIYKLADGTVKTVYSDVETKV